VKVVNFIAEGRYGGPQARIVQVAARLRPMGIETTVVLPTRESDRFRAELQRAEVPFVQMDLHRLTKQWRELAGLALGFAPEVRRLARLLERLGADLIHCNGSWQLQGVIAGRIARIATVWHLNDTYTPWPFPEVFRMVARQCADGFILAGDRAKDFYLTDPVLRSRPNLVIQAPVNTERFDPAHVTADPAIAALPGLKIVTIANLNPAKDLETFVQACGLLADRHPGGVSFVVAGATFDTQKGYAERISQLASSKRLHIHFLGRRDDVPSVLKAADVYVCSSAREASPMAVWEAMAIGKPIVSTDVGDVGALLGATEAGIIVPVRDAESLAGRVSELLDDARLRATLGERARKVAIERLGLESCAERHASIYRSLVREHVHAAAS
jgi:glycosyltransferase involved in cell wall biosynthesis